MFHLNQVSLTVDDQKRLQTTTLSIHQHQITTIIGHNGCGKSTLLQLLTKQHTPTQGYIEYKNKDLMQWVPQDFAREVAFLPQTLAAPVGITLAQLVEFGRFPHQKLFQKLSAEDQAIIHQSLDNVGLLSIKNKQLSQVSGGERQRAWIAMMLAQQCPCLILDEPTSALDLKYQYELLNLLQDLKQNLGLTIIMVLHDINLATEFSDEIIALYQGQVIQQATPRTLLTSTYLQDIFEVAFECVEVPKRATPFCYVSNA